MNLCFLLVLVFLQQLIYANCVPQENNNTCDPPVVPEYLPDHEYGSYCRFSPVYSQIDFVFVIAVTYTDSNSLQMLSTILSNSLQLIHGQFSNSSLTNDAAFVIVSNTSRIVVPFGALNTAEEVSNQFKNLKNWTNLYGSSYANFTDVFITIDQVLFDYSNNRGKFITVISNNVITASYNYTQNDLKIVEKMKMNGVKIFTVRYNADSANDNLMDEYLHAISTPGWGFYISLENFGAAVSKDLSNKFHNFARQAGCQCPSGTTQFSLLLPFDNDLLGPAIAEYYSDCIFKVESALNFKQTFNDAIESCSSDYRLNARLVALNTTLKWKFIEDFLGAEPNLFWSGKIGSSWMTYNGSSLLPLTYIPISYFDPTIQEICQNTYGITTGGGAAIASKFLCATSYDMKFLPLCEAKAHDSFNNPRLCTSN